VFVQWDWSVSVWWGPLGLINWGSNNVVGSWKLVHVGL